MDDDVLVALELGRRYGHALLPFTDALLALLVRVRAGVGVGVRLGLGLELGLELGLGLGLGLGPGLGSGSGLGSEPGLGSGSVVRVRVRVRALLDVLGPAHGARRVEEAEGRAPSRQVLLSMVGLRRVSRRLAWGLLVQGSSPLRRTKPRVGQLLTRKTAWSG